MIKPLTMVAPALMPDTETTGSTRMDRKRPDRIGQLGAVLGALALALSVATVLQASSNGDLQAAAVQGQAQVAKGRALASVDNELVGLLAKAAAENHDDSIRALLAQNGVTFRAGPAPTTPLPPAAPTSSATN
ncbi:hypothetical protein KX816_05515 [Sphingosinicellaceae bacterium]|nr:hypothetical protein KX816_05515 [Sphingosinicellaceae bacterium]